MIDLFLKMFSGGSNSNTLQDRNRGIITNHYNKIRYTGFYKVDFVVDRMIRDCINDIATSEGDNRIAPGNKDLSKWETTVPEKYKRLLRTLRPLFKKRYQERTDEYF